MALKRAASVATPTPPHRNMPTPVSYQPFAITNLTNGETIHQSCLLVVGKSHAFENAGDDYISVTVTDCFENISVPQTWPTIAGNFKALVMLPPGDNQITFNLHHAGGVCDSVILAVTYTPLLQLPPLHLAILVAKDSPLLIDCPPSKMAGISSAHSDVGAAISKFRMTAYMWQAMTAEDLRQKGLGRRSFRLDDEWTANTTARYALQGEVAGSSKMVAAAKVHLVRTEKTATELRDAQYAQQNPNTCKPNMLHQIFENALKAHGAPFSVSSRPVVAGMILDSTYSIDSNLVLGHAALGCHKRDGLSLGMFGSHLTYSWPRFLEEIPACLRDSTEIGPTVGNDNRKCDTLSQACSVGQGAFLHEVGHAFGAEHTTGIMARGHSKHWWRNFIGHAERDNDAEWDLQEGLRFKLMPHFKLPGDKPISAEFKDASIHVRPVVAEGDERFIIECKSGIASVSIENGNAETKNFLMNTEDVHFDWCMELGSFTRAYPLKISVLAMNGREKIVVNAWQLMADRPFVTIPLTNLQLRRESVKSRSLESDVDRIQYSRQREMWTWATMLRERGHDGKIHAATAIELRIGAIMDGAVVYYADGHHTNCGPVTHRNGYPHVFGGQAFNEVSISDRDHIVKVELSRGHDTGWCSLKGIRMTLSDGRQWGCLNEEYRHEIIALEPASDERIVGFYGQSERSCGFTHEFGIMTAPKDAELPESVYDMPELKNVDITPPARGCKPPTDIDMVAEDSEDYDSLSEHTVE